jgi:hypothetical protein
MIRSNIRHHIYQPYSSENKKSSQVADSVTCGDVIYSMVYLIKLIRSKLRTRDFKRIVKIAESVHRDLMLKMICFIPEHYIYYPYSSENKKSSQVADSANRRIFLKSRVLSLDVINLIRYTLKLVILFGGRDSVHHFFFLISDEYG